MPAAVDVIPFLRPPESGGPSIEPSFAEHAKVALSSHILGIAAEIRALKAGGKNICDLTVGDFSPLHTPAPAALLDGITRALQAGHTYYPPSDGLPALREAIARFTQRELGLSYPTESILVGGGSRPLIYGTYRTLLDPGDTVIFPVPSWNNVFYAALAQANPVALQVSERTHFFPDLDAIAPHLSRARLLVINSPSNPTGAVIDPNSLRAIAHAVLEENHRRSRTGAKALFLLYDQVYWQLTFGDHHHSTPVHEVPEVAPYTILVDGISKGFAATGLRVGWGLMAPSLRDRMADILGHAGAWAPRPEQVATAAFLDDAVAVLTYREDLRRRIGQRLDVLAKGFAHLASDGFAVGCVPPQGAPFLSVQIRWPGKTSEQIRRILIDQAALAVVPFSAFGQPIDTGWFRLSVGAVSASDLEAIFPRLRTVLPQSPQL